MFPSTDRKTCRAASSSRAMRSALLVLGSALIAGFGQPPSAQAQYVPSASHPGAAPIARAPAPRRLAVPTTPPRAGVFRPGFGPFATFPYGRHGRFGFGFPYYGTPFGTGFGGDTTARASAEATASPRVGTAIINAPGNGQGATTAPMLQVPQPRAADTALEAAGLSASGGGEGAAHVRKVLADIAGAREAERLSRRTGSRYIYVDRDLRELANERRALRREEGRRRNPHILYLGFDE